MASGHGITALSYGWSTSRLAKWLDVNEGQCLAALYTAMQINRYSQEQINAAFAAYGEGVFDQTGPAPLS